MSVPITIAQVQTNPLLIAASFQLPSGTSVTLHFYEKHGFHAVHTFECPPGCGNYDMVLEI
jgi:hypothetical protein